MRKSTLHLHVSALTVALLLALVQSAEATTIDCGAGDVPCLIAAINQANAYPHHKTTIRLAAGTYALTNIDNNTNGPNGLPSIASALTIEGGADGATLARAFGTPDLFRILHVALSGRLTLHKVTVSNGDSRGAAGETGGGLFNNGGVVTIVDSSFTRNGLESDTGALVNNSGVTTIADTTFTGNFGSSVAAVLNVRGVMYITRTVFESNDGLGAGGLQSVDGYVRITQSRFSHNHGHLGVAGVRLSGGTASINQTTFSSNAGDPSGGILVDSPGRVVVRDSAFVENLGNDGAIFNLSGTIDVINTTFARNIAYLGLGIAIYNAGRMTVVNSTFAENAAGGAGGSVIASGPNATTLLENTIVVHNSEDLNVRDCGGVLTSLGHNLIGAPSCLITLQPSDLVGDAGLGPLEDDATPGDAHFPLLPGSQAIDAANKAACSIRDQIGQLRRPRCDIGAVEFRRGHVVN